MPEYEHQTANVAPHQLEEYFAETAVAMREENAMEREDQTSALAVAGENGQFTGVQPVGSQAGPASAPLSPKDEIARLRRLVKEKDHAILRATLSATDLQQQLEQERAESLNLRTELQAVQVAVPEPPPDTVHPGVKATFAPEAQAEIERQRREFQGIQKSLERDHSRRKEELVKIRAQWFQTQQQLEQETRSRRLEVAQSSGKIARLEQDLTAASTKLTKSYESGSKTKSRNHRMMAIAAALVMVLGAGVMWTEFSARASSGPVAQAGAGDASGVDIPATQTAQSLPQQVAQPPSQAGVKTAVAGTGAGTAALRPASAFSNTSQAEFQGALRSLNISLSRFGTRSPEEILREVRNRSGDHTLCAFQWNNGQPALLYGGDSGKESIAGALSRCAAAVDKSH